MCDIGAITLGLSVIGIVTNTIGAIQQQRSYQDYQDKQTEATASNYTYQTRALQNRFQEEQQASALQLQQLQIQNMKAKAAAEASVATAGVEGSTIDNLMSGYDRAAAVNNYVSAKNMQLKGLQYNDELAAMRISAINSINAQQPYTSTSGFAALMSGAGGVTNTYTKLYGTQTPDWLTNNPLTRGSSSFSLFQPKGIKIDTNSLYGGFA